MAGIFGLRRKTNKPERSFPGNGNINARKDSEVEGRQRSSSVDSASQVADIELPVYKKERRPSVPFWKCNNDPVNPALRDHPPTIIERPETSVFRSSRLTESSNHNLSNCRDSRLDPCAVRPPRLNTSPESEVRYNAATNQRLSNTSDLPASPRSSTEFSPDRSMQDNRDSGLGDMGEADIQTKFLSDTVQVLKLTIDSHTNDLIAKLKKRRDDLKCQLEYHLIKSCQEIKEGKTGDQKMEFNPQNDLGVGVISFMDEPTASASEESASEESVYMNMYINVPSSLENRLSSGSDHSQEDYVNVPESLTQILAEMSPESRACRTQYPPPPSPHHGREHSVPGYINTTNRPPPPPKPAFRKKPDNKLYKH